MPTPLRRCARLAAIAALLAHVGCGETPLKHVLLVSIDSLRADRVGVYGNPRPVSPTLDRLAREGVLFEAAASATSWTLPAHASLLTGRSQHRHATVRIDDRLPRSVELLPERFSERGYETVGFFSGPLLHPSYGFDRGFQQYIDCESPETAKLPGVLALSSSHSDRTNPLITDAFEHWLDVRSERPFFAFVHMWDVHYDYIPPEPYASMFDSDYHGALDGKDIQGSGFPLRSSRRDVDHLLALYDGELRYTDDTLGRLLEFLEARGLLTDTLVVVTADHGDEFLEHGGKGHKSSLFEELVHVPLILSARHGLPRGQRIAAPVSLIDVAPTILDLLHLPALEGADGVSLVPLLRGSAREHPPVSAALYDSFTGEAAVFSMREGPVKLIFRPATGRVDRYDLRSDPGEKSPVPAPPEDPLARALAREFEAAGEAMKQKRSQEHERNEQALSADVIERLRGLGYVQ